MKSLDKGVFSFDMCFKKKRNRNEKCLKCVKKEKEKKPETIDEFLKDVKLVRGGTYSAEHPEDPLGDITYQDLPAGAIRGLYFSAKWYEPCSEFTPKLAETYKYIRKKEPGFEIIFVTCDECPDSWKEHIENMPWLCIPYRNLKINKDLFIHYKIIKRNGIPALLLLDGNNQVCTTLGRQEVIVDPLARNYPWGPKSVNFLTRSIYFGKLKHHHPGIILFIKDEKDIQFAESILTPVANNYYEKKNITLTIPRYGYEVLEKESNPYLHFIIGVDDEIDPVISDQLKLRAGLNESLRRRSCLRPLLVLIDFPNKRYAVMCHSFGISIDSVTDFVENFDKGNLKLEIIKENSNITVVEDDDKDDDRDKK